jgi:hypothetical protein
MAQDVEKLNYMAFEVPTDSFLQLNLSESFLFKLLLCNARRYSVCLYLLDHAEKLIPVSKLTSRWRCVHHKLESLVHKVFNRWQY